MSTFDNNADRKSRVIANTLTTLTLFNNYVNVLKVMFTERSYKLEYLIHVPITLRENILRLFSLLNCPYGNFI